MSQYLAGERKAVSEGGVNGRLFRSSGEKGVYVHLRLLKGEKVCDEGHHGVSFCDFEKMTVLVYAAAAAAAYLSWYCMMLERRLRRDHFLESRWF